MLFVGPISIGNSTIFSDNDFENNFIKYQDKVLIIINRYFIQIKANYKIHWGDYVETPDLTTIDSSITYNYTRLSVYQNIPMLYGTTEFSANEVLDRMIKLINNDNFGEPVWLNSQVLSTGGIQPISIAGVRHISHVQYPAFRTMGKSFPVPRITNRKKGRPRLFINEQMYESQKQIKANDDVSSYVSSISKSEEDMFYYLNRNNIKEVSVVITSHLNYKNYEAEKYDSYAPLKLNSFMERNDDRFLVYYHTISKTVVEKVIKRTVPKVFKLAIPSSGEMDKMVALAYYLSFSNIFSMSGNKVGLSAAPTQPFFDFNFIDPEYPEELRFEEKQSAKTDIEKYASQWTPLSKPIHFDFFSVYIYIKKNDNAIVYNYPIIKFFRSKVELFVVFKNNIYYHRLRNILLNHYNLIDFIIKLFEKQMVKLIESNRTSTRHMGYAVVS